LFYFFSGFIKPIYLSRHKRRQHSDKMFGCSCGMAFIKKSVMEQHELMHRAVRVDRANERETYFCFHCNGQFEGIYIKLLNVKTERCCHLLSKIENITVFVFLANRGQHRPVFPEQI